MIACFIRGGETVAATSPSYNGVAFKASHNSYERDEDIHAQLLWDPDEPWQGGCRGLEIDINRHSDASGGTSARYFQVSHNRGGYGTPLAAYLGYMLSWHLADPGHDPVFVDLDIKSESGDASLFPGEIDTYLIEWFDAALIYTPGKLLLKEPTLDLVAIVQKYGWPTLADLKGKFLFCLSGHDPWKKLYAETDPGGRLCFADFKVSDTDKSSPVTSGYRVVANLDLKSDHYDNWKTLIPKLRAQAFLVRGYVLNSSELWSRAQGAGVNVLSTDKVKNHDWAKVGDEPFAASPG